MQTPLPSGLTQTLLWLASLLVSAGLGILIKGLLDKRKTDSEAVLNLAQADKTHAEVESVSITTMQAVVRETAALAERVIAAQGSRDERIACLERDLRICQDDKQRLSLKQPTLAEERHYPAE